MKGAPCSYSLEIRKAVGRSFHNEGQTIAEARCWAKADTGLCETGCARSVCIQ